MNNTPMDRWALGVIIVMGSVLLWALVSAAYSATKDAFPRAVAMFVAAGLVTCGIAAVVGVVYIAGSLGLALGLGGAK